MIEVGRVDHQERQQTAIKNANRQPSKQPTSDQQKTTNKNEKNDKEEKNEKKVEADITFLKSELERLGRSGTDLYQSGESDGLACNPVHDVPVLAD